MTEKKKEQNIDAIHVDSPEELVAKAMELNNASDNKYHAIWAASETKEKEIQEQANLIYNDMIAPYERTFSYAKQTYKAAQNEIYQKTHVEASKQIDALIKERNAARELHEVETNAIKAWFKNESSRLKNKVIRSLEKKQN